MSMQQAEIYISYAWGRGKSIASKRRQAAFDDILALLRANDFSVTVDFEGIGYKDSIRNFMETLGKGKYIVVIISDRYLKSESCMFEASEMISNGDFKERIFPIVLPDAKIFTPATRNAYLNYWTKKKNDQRELFNSIENKEHAQSHLDSLKLYDQIVSNFDRIIAQISDMNTMSLEYHKANNYEAILKSIQGASNTQTTKQLSLVEAYTLLNIMPTSTPSEVQNSFEKLQAENQQGLLSSTVKEVKEAHILAFNKLNDAYEMISKKADEYLKKQKTEIRRLIRQKKYSQAKILLGTLQLSEPEDLQLDELQKRCVTLGEQKEYGRPESTEAKVETPKQREKTTQTTNKNVKETANSTSYTDGKMVQSQKMRNEMQMQKKVTESNKKKTYWKIVLPVSLAILSVIFGFIAKEKILVLHVDNIIAKSEDHVANGEISNAVRLLEDESRDLVYETRLADKLNDFTTLKHEYSELNLKIKSYKRKKKWKLAERGILRLMEYTPKDSFLNYRLRDIQRELKKNDFQFWLVSATEAIKQGEDGYDKAKLAFNKAKTVGIRSKVLDVNMHRLDSLIDLAYNKHMENAKTASSNKNKAISEYQAALIVKPNDATASKLLSELK